MIRNLLLPAAAAAVALQLLTPRGVSAQAAPLVIEVRGGATVPLGSFAEGARVGEGANSGRALSVGFTFSGSGRRATTFGFSQHRFDCAPAGCAQGGEYVATGLDAGLRFSLRTRGDVIPWVSVGASTLRVEMPSVRGADEGVSDLGFGGEVGAGLYVGAFRSIAFNPAVRARALNSELAGGTLLRLRYLLVELGLSLAF